MEKKKYYERDTSIYNTCYNCFFRCSTYLAQSKLINKQLTLNKEQIKFTKVEIR